MGSFKVNWFEAESPEHRYGQPGEAEFDTGEEMVDLVRQLSQRDDILHVQVEHPEGWGDWYRDAVGSPWITRRNEDKVQI